MKKMGKSVLKVPKKSSVIAFVPDKTAVYTISGVFKDLQEVGTFISKAGHLMELGNIIDFSTEVLPDKSVKGFIEGSYRDIKEFAAFFTAD